MTAIRPARTDDAATLAGLTTQLGYAADTAAVERRLDRILADGEHAVLVAVDDADAPIGWVHVARATVLQSDDRAVVHGLVVDASRTGAGIGSELLAAAERWAQERSISTMLVRSRTTRERAHRFYERAGYRLAKTSQVFEKPLG